MMRNLDLLFGSADRVLFLKIKCEDKKSELTDMIKEIGCND